MLEKPVVQKVGLDLGKHDGGVRACGELLELCRAIEPLPSRRHVEANGAGIYAAEVQIVHEQQGRVR